MIGAQLVRCYTCNMVGMIYTLAHAARVQRTCFPVPVTTFSETLCVCRTALMQKFAVCQRACLCAIVPLVGKFLAV